MAQINLLPWREALREERKKEYFMILIATVILAAVLAALVYLFFNFALDEQRQANDKITAANAQLDVQLQSLSGLQARRDEIISRMKVIQDLQGQRPVVVRIFDELPRLTPDHVYLSDFERKDDKFTIKGYAQSPNDVSDFLRNLEASQWFHNAFMNSYQGAPASAAPVSGGVAPRPEDSYGQFVISVDLRAQDTIQGAQSTSAKGLGSQGGAS